MSLLVCVRRQVCGKGFEAISGQITNPAASQLERLGYDREHLACAKLNEHGPELFRQKYKEFGLFLDWFCFQSVVLELRVPVGSGDCDQVR